MKKVLLKVLNKYWHSRYCQYQYQYFLPKV